MVEEARGNERIIMHNIYENNILIINTALKIVNNIRIQNYDKAVRLLTALVSYLTKSAEDIFTNLDFYNQNGVIVTQENFVKYLKDITDAQEKKDFIHLADMLETEIVPMYMAMQDMLKLTGEDLYAEHDFFAGNIEYIRIAAKNGIREAEELLREGYLIDGTISQNIENEIYRLESARDGNLTIKKGIEGVYLHGTNRPLRDAELFAKEYMRDDYERYIVWGIGLGYHIRAMLDMEAPKIIVIEPDINMIYLALMNIDFPELEDGRLVIIHDGSYTKLAGYVGEEKINRLIIHEPSLHAECQIAQKINAKNILGIIERLQQIFIRESSIRNTYPLMLSNFKSNIVNCTGYVDEITSDFRGKKVIIIAAGPSLDKNVHYLSNLKTMSKNKRRDYVILAVGTVYRKLIKMDIRPDYVIVADANYRVFSQVRDVCNEQIPLLILSTACKKFARYYTGPRYLIAQNELDISEQYAKEHNYRTYDTGGSVTTTALSVAVKSGAKEVIFIGLDLAYTDGYAHATGTSSRSVDTNGRIRVKGVNGDEVYASNVFIIYRNWIENEIKKHPNIEFIDATEGGAKIAGTKIMSLEDALKKK